MLEESNSQSNIEIPTAPRDESRMDNRSKSAIGIVLLVLGVGFLLDNLFKINLGEIIGVWWPLIFVYLGLDFIGRGKPLYRTIWYVVLIASVAYILMSQIAGN